MSNIYQADPKSDYLEIKTLYWEYLQWANTQIESNYGFCLDINSMLQENMNDLYKFAPPGGCLLLVDVVDQTAGCACMHQIDTHTGEIKRMYVRPAFRRQGLGRALLAAILERAEEIGYTRLLLDSTRFMKAAHALYRSFGFREVKPYPESEIPEEYWQYWIFLERVLD
jgi:GNAT superfamily N-acetyltransferase